MIPRIIHHVWPGDDEFPERRELIGGGHAEFHAWRLSWMKLHPGWSFMFHRLEPTGDARTDAILARDDLSPVVKSDILRWSVLVRFGGLYLDTDFECLAPFELLLSDRAGLFLAVEPAQPFWEAKGVHQFNLSPALIGAVRAHPFAVSVLSLLLARADETSAKDLNQYPHVLTGPGLVTAAWRADSFGVTVHPSSHFHPEGAPPGAARYATHHWAGKETKAGWVNTMRSFVARPLSGRE